MSMSPLHGAVLGGAAVVASPALWLTLVEGTLPLGDALMRYLLSVLICWVALNVIVQFAFPDRETLKQQAEPADQDGDRSPERAGTDTPSS